MATGTKLSQLMIDALVSASEDEFGFQLGEIKRQTYVALEGRGLSSGGWLTVDGIKARNEHVSTPEDPTSEEIQARADQMLTESPEDILQKAVDLDKPYHVPNRKDRRNLLKTERAKRRADARRRDQRVSTFA